MNKTLYIVPCFIIVENAKSIADAVQQASNHQIIQKGSTLLLDENLPTVAMVHNTKNEYPHSMEEVPALKHYLHKI